MAYLDQVFRARTALRAGAAKAKRRRALLQHNPVKRHRGERDTVKLTPPTPAYAELVATPSSHARPARPQEQSASIRLLPNLASHLSHHRPHLGGRVATHNFDVTDTCPSQSLLFNGISRCSFWPKMMSAPLKFDDMKWATICIDDQDIDPL